MGKKISNFCQYLDTCQYFDGKNLTRAIYFVDDHNAKITGDRQEDFSGDAKVFEARGREVAKLVEGELREFWGSVSLMQSQKM